MTFDSDEYGAVVIPPRAVNITRYVTDVRVAITWTHVWDHECSVDNCPARRRHGHTVTQCKPTVFLMQRQSRVGSLWSKSVPCDVRKWPAPDPTEQFHRGPSNDCVRLTHVPHTRHSYIPHTKVNVTQPLMHSGMAHVINKSQFYLHTPHSSVDRMNHTCLCFRAKAGTHLPTPNRWKAELAWATRTLYKQSAQDCYTMFITAANRSKTFTSHCKVKYTSICIACLRANASNTLRYGSHSVTCKRHHICLYSQSQSITALWPVLVAPLHEKMARLNWPGWLVKLR